MDDDNKEMYSQITALSLLLVVLTLAVSWLVWFVVVALSVGLWILEVFTYGSSMATL